ncbi:hypothetical protein LZ318_07880 [Saccharopolyspora indica]|uniref:WXG100-like domain-containing protein n=1 Tax=Saccharopolyspora indica TaxID=1229659 RepID=UPI0022EB84DE|nr:hypothetical protein [Saccharopolyspora indica]MDA3649553.1 hypothetical protein [Saccharopolyspora indica]
MGIEIPDAVKWLTPIVVGADWPEGDETALRRVAEAWVAAGQDVDGVIQETEAAIQAAVGTMEGQTHDAFVEFAKGYVNGDAGHLPDLKKLCEALGEGADGAALEIEYTKMSIIAALLILAAQIAAMIASAVATFGASTAGIPVAQAATQMTVRMFFQQLLQKIAQQILINVAINVGVDAGIQSLQFARGDRQSWDWSNTGNAAVSGVAAGLAGGLVDGIAPGVGQHIGKDLMGNATKNFTEAAAYGAARGAMSGMLGNVINKGLHGEAPSWNDFTSGAISGGVSGATGGMQSRHEGLNATWEGNGRGEASGGGEWTSGSNTQGWRFETDDGAVVGANVDSPYGNGFNSGTAGQHIENPIGPNNVNNNDYGDVDDRPQGKPEKLDLPEGPN